MQAQNDAPLIKKANNEFQSGNYSIAVNDYRQLLAKEPKSIDFNFKYATCLFHIDDINKAAKYYDLILNMYEPPVESYFYRGKIYQNNYDFQNAIKSFEKYISLKSKKEIDLGAQIEIQHCKNALAIINSPGSIKTIKRFSANRSDFFKNYEFTNLFYDFYSIDEVFTKANNKKNYKPTYAFIRGMKYRFFASYGANSETGKDIYIQKKNAENEWGDPIRLGTEINSALDEEYPFFDEENGVLYFSSKGHNSIGGYDIFKVKFDLSQNLASNRENLNFPFSSPNDDLFFVPDLNTQNAYFASNRNGQLSKVEVFLIELSDKPIQLTFLSGKLTDQVDALNKSVQINIFSDQSKESFGPFYSDEEGNYLISVPKPGVYNFLVKVNGSTKEFSEIVEIPRLKENKKLEQEIVYKMMDSQEKLEIINRILDQESLLAKLEPKKYKEMAKLEVNAATLVTEIKNNAETELGVLGYSDLDSVKAFEQLTDDLLDIQLDIEKNLKFEEELISKLDSNQVVLDKLKNELVDIDAKLINANDVRDRNKLETEKRNLEREIQKITKQNYVLTNEISAINNNKIISRETHKELRSLSDSLNKLFLNSKYDEAKSLVSERKNEIKKLLDNRIQDKEKSELKKQLQISEQKRELETKIDQQKNQIVDFNNQILLNEQKLSVEKNKKEQERIQSEIKQLKKSLNLAKELNDSDEFELAKINLSQEAYYENKELISRIDSRAEEKNSFQEQKNSPKNQTETDVLINQIVEIESTLNSTVQGKYEQDISQIKRISNESDRNSKLKEREQQYQYELKRKLDLSSNESEKENLLEQIQLSQSRINELNESLAQTSKNNGTVNDNANNNSNSNEIDKNENQTSNQNGNVNENSNNNSNSNEVAKNENQTSNQNGNENENSNNNSNSNEVAKNENQTSNQNGNSNNANNNSNSNEVAKNENQTSNQNGNENENSNNANNNSNSNEVAKNENETSNQNGKVNENSNNANNNTNSNEVAKNENQTSNQNGNVNENSNNSNNNSNSNEVAKNENQTSNQNGNENENLNNANNNSNSNEFAKNENQTSNQNGNENENSNNANNNSNSNEVAKNENQTSNQNGNVNENSNNANINSNSNEVAKNENQTSNQNGNENKNLNNANNNSNSNEFAKNENQTSNQNGNENENSNNANNNSNSNEVAKNENQTSNQNANVNENLNNANNNSNSNEVAKNENQTSNQNGNSNNANNNSNSNEIDKNENQTSNQNGNENDKTNNVNNNSNSHEIAKNENQTSNQNANEKDKTNNEIESKVNPEDLKQSVLYNLNASTLERQIANKKEELAKANSDNDKVRIEKEISQLKIESEINSKRSIENEQRARFNKEFPGLKILSNDDLVAELNEIKMKELSIQNKITSSTNDQEKILLKEEKNQLASIRLDIESKINDSSKKSDIAANISPKSDNLTDSELESLRQSEKYKKYIQERTKSNELLNELESKKIENRVLREQINKSILNSKSNELSLELINLGNQLKKNEEDIKTKEKQIENQFLKLNEFDDAAQFEWLLVNRIKPIQQIASIDNSQVQQSTFTIGRNPNIAIDKPLPVNVNSPSGLIYRVQVGAFRKPIPNAAFRDFSPVSGDLLANGLTCYMAGYFNSAQNAIVARKQIRALGYADAFIVAYCDGKRISFAKGRELEISGRCKALTENELILALNENASVSEQNGNSPQPKTINPNSQDYLNAPNAKKAELGENNQQLFFTVQVGVFNKPITNNQLKQFDDLVTFKSEKGQIRYSSGMFESVNDAKNHRNQAVNKGVADAYVVAYYQGKRISIAEANNLLAKNGTDILKKSTPLVNPEIANNSVITGNLVELNIELPEVSKRIKPDSLIQFALSCNVEEVRPNLEKLNRIGIFTYQSETGKIVSPKMKTDEVTIIHNEYLKDFEREVQPIDSNNIIELDVTNQLSNGSLIDWLLRSDLNYRFESSDELKKLNIFLDNDFQRNAIVRKAEELKISILNE
jgi:hypothetical protein